MKFTSPKKLDTFNSLILLSILFHILLFYFFPSGLIEESHHVEDKIFEVELEYLEPPQQTEKSTAAESVSNTKDSAAAVAPVKRDKPKVSIKDLINNSNDKSLQSAPEVNQKTPTSSTPSPTLRSSLSATDSDTLVSENMLNSESKMVESGFSRTSDSFFKFNPTITGDVSGGGDIIGESNGVNNSGNGLSGKITGELQYRNIVSVPVFPVQKIESSVPVTFKLLVAPDGTVVNVTPVRKGNPELEKVGLSYLKLFRFNAIQSLSNQSGIIELVISKITN